MTHFHANQRDNSRVFTEYSVLILEEELMYEATCKGEKNVPKENFKINLTSHEVIKGDVSCRIIIT